MKDKVLSFVKSLPDRGKAFAILAVTAHVLVFAHFFGPGHDWGGDFSLYIAQADALIQGNSEELAAVNWDCMLRSERTMGPDLYPVGLPLLMVPIMLLFGPSIAAFKVMNLLCFLGSLWMIPRIFRHWGYERQSYWLVVILAIHPFFIEFTHQVIAELPALFFSFWGIHLYLLSRRTNKLQWLFWSGLAMGFSLLIKSLAITLVGAAAICMLVDWFKKEPMALRKGLVFLAGLLLCLLPAKILYPDSSSSYFEQLASFTPDRIWNNFRYTIQLPRYLLAGWKLLFYPFAALLLLGLFRSRRHETILFPWAFLILHLILLTLWTYHEGPRFMLIVIPVLYLFVLFGLDGLRNMNRSVVRIFASLMLISCVWGLSKESAAFFEGEKYPGKAESNSEHAEALWEYIREHTHQEDTFVFFKPRVLRWKTGRIGYYHDHLNGALTVHPRYYINVRIRGGFDDSTFSIAYQNPEFILFEFPPELR